METFSVFAHRTISFVLHFHYLIEAFLIATISILLFFKKRKPKSVLPNLSEQEKDALIAKWKPESLVPYDDDDDDSNAERFKPKLIDQKINKIMTINGKNYFNMATTNFLGFVGDKRIEDVAKSAIFKYGVGSCGPRSFYGTLDIHLVLEHELAAFMNCEEAVLYSYGFVTIASAIPAYAKSGDIIYADKEVNFAIQKGLNSSKSKIQWFEHNNMEDLENLLKAQAELDKKNFKKVKTRQFIIVEGLYAKTADLCPLKEIINLKWKYKVRVFIDESLSFGVIGKTGRDMIMGSLENSLASCGGFCCGRSFVVEHQRLSGLGYCFSASLPALLTTAASKALEIMKNEPERIERLKQNSIFFHYGIKKALENTNFFIQASEFSPLKHILYKHKNMQIIEEKLDALVNEAYNNQIILTRARYLIDEEIFTPTPSVKIMCNSEMTLNEIESAIKKIELAIKKIV